MDNFFSNDTYFIDEKAFTIINEYKIYNTTGAQIGVARENRTTARIILSLFVGKKYLPFTIDLVDAQGRVVSSLVKGVSVFLSTIKMLDARGLHIATIKQKFGLTPKFEITDISGRLLGSIKGDFVAWNYIISDASGAQVGTISKKFSGIGREIFTTADKYIVSVDPSLTDEVLRSTIISIAAGLDMILKENE